MKRMIMYVMVLMAFCGCAAEYPAMETISDTVEPVVSVYGEISKEFLVEIPENAQLEWQTDTETYYSVDDGAMDIWTIHARSYDAAVMLRLLTGTDPDDAHMISLGDSWAYTWYCQTETGGRNCCAVLEISGTDGFAVICMVDESAGNRYDDLLYAVAASVRTKETGEI